MSNRLILASLLGLSLSAAVQAESLLSPVYAQAGQYTATLHSQSQHWNLSPLAGDELEIRGGELCPRTEMPPQGLWLLARDEAGRAELVAPSATLLPAGHSGRVALRACDDPELRNASVKAYGVPQQVLDLLVANSGAVLVDD